MHFSIDGIILAGLLGTLTMTISMYFAHAFGASRITPGFYLGTFLFGIRRVSYALGLILHFAIGLGIAWVYAGIMTLLGIPGGVEWGLLFGCVHWILAMVFYGLVGPWHPAVRRDELEAPGFFAVHEGWTETWGSLFDHLLYGAVVGGMLGFFHSGWNLVAPYSFSDWQQPSSLPAVAWLALVIALVVAFIVFATVTVKFRPSEVFASGLELDEEMERVPEETVEAVELPDTNRPENEY